MKRQRPEWLTKESLAAAVHNRRYSKAYSRKWMRIIYLYYTRGFTAREIAREYRTSRQSIKDIINKLQATMKLEHWWLKGKGSQ